MLTDAASSLRTGLRKLWADHVIWTRQYIVAVTNGTPDAGAAAERLLKNQEHIGAAIVPYYGQAAGEKLASLLKEHILIAVELLAAAKAGDDARFQHEDQKWTANAAAIATFLSVANPQWPKKDVEDLLSVHLSLTKAEVVARLGAKWDDDVTAFDDIFTEILTVSDTLATGIIQQFPDKLAHVASRPGGCCAGYLGAGGDPHARDRSESAGLPRGTWNRRQTLQARVIHRYPCAGAHLHQ